VSIADNQAEIVELFEMLDDWQDRYRMIIELGRELPALSDAQKTDANKVKGCQSQVWLVSRLDDGGHLLLNADSDAAIVRGLIAILLKVFSGQTPDAILAARPEFIDDIGLSKHLSQNRANGLSAMIKKIRGHAELARQTWDARAQ